MTSSVSDHSAQEYFENPDHGRNLRWERELQGKSRKSPKLSNAGILKANRTRRLFANIRERGDKFGGVNRIRHGHVKRVLDDRWGKQIPDDDAGREDLIVLLNVQACATSPQRRMKALQVTINERAKWFSEEQLVERIAANPIYYRADTLGRKLNLRSADRDRLRVYQIGAVDLDAIEREELRKKKACRRMQNHRRSKGVRPRGEYLDNALTATEPWEPFGVSRRTWERYRAKGTLSQLRAKTRRRKRGSAQRLASSRKSRFAHRHASQGLSQVRAQNNMATCTEQTRDNRGLPPASLAFHGENVAGASKAQRTPVVDGKARVQLVTSPAETAALRPGVRKAIAFNLAGRAWGRPGRAVVGKALREGVDVEELIQAIEKCTADGKPLQWLAREVAT